MDSLQNYGGSSSSSGSGSESETENEENTAHLKPVDPSLSVAKSLAVVAAPDVVPMVKFFSKLLTFISFTMIFFKENF